MKDKGERIRTRRSEGTRVNDKEKRRDKGQGERQGKMRRTKMKYKVEGK